MGRQLSDTTFAEPEDRRRPSSVAKASYRGSNRPYIIVCLLLWTLIGGMLVLNLAHSDDNRLFLGFVGSGHHGWVVDDSTLYIDMIEQAQKPGVWFFENRFSPETGPPRYLNAIWLVLGKISSLISLSPLAVYTAFRFVAVLIFIIALRSALREFVIGQAARPLVLVLVVFGGGLGWIFSIANRSFLPVGSFFIEAMKSEVWSFLALTTLPHNVLAMSLVLLAMAGLAASGRGSRAAMCTVPIVALALATFHPYDLPVIYATGCIFLILMRLRDSKINYGLLTTYVLLIIASAPILAYHWWALRTAPDLQGLLLQNSIQPYGSLRYLVGLLPLGLLAFRRLTITLAHYKAAGDAELLIMSWAVLLPLLLYSYPDIGFAWKLTVCMPIPICVLAVSWIEQRAQQKRRAGRAIDRPLWLASPVIAVVVVASLLSSALITVAMVNAARRQAHPFYISRADHDALTWLAAQPGSDETVLSARYPGIHVPRLAHKRAFIGHDHQSVDFRGKMKFATALFDDGELSAEELETLLLHKVRWLFYGLNEQEWWQIPESCSQLRLVYDKGNIQIYQVMYNTPSSI